MIRGDRPPRTACRWVGARRAANDPKILLPNAACTTALIDRLLHHSEIISIEGESYRKREAEAEAEAEAAKEAIETRRRKKRS